MSREAIQMGRPSKVTSDSSSIHSSQQKARNHISDANHSGLIDPSLLKQDHQFNQTLLGSQSALRLPSRPLHNGGHSDDKNSTSIWHQNSFGNQGFTLGDISHQMMGFDMFDPSTKHILPSEGYQSAGSLPGSFSPPGSMSTTERSGSTDSGRSLLSASSPDTVTGLGRAWNATDTSSDGGTLGSCDNSGMHHGSPFRMDKGRHLQTIREQFNLQTVLFQKPTEHLNTEFQNKRINIPHVLNPSGTSIQIVASPGIDGHLNIGITPPQQFASFSSKSIGELIEDMLHGSSAARQMQQENVTQQFDFDSEFTSLATNQTNSDSNNFYKNVSQSNANVVGKNDALQQNFGSVLDAQKKFDQTNFQTIIFNGLGNTNTLLDAKQFQSLSNISGFYPLSLMNETSASSTVSTSVATSDANQGHDQMFNFGEHLMSTTVSTSQADTMDYTRGSTGGMFSAESWLNVGPSSSNQVSSAEIKCEDTSHSSVECSPAMRLSAEALTLDAEGMISSVDHLGDVYKKPLTDLAACKGESAESSSADNFMLDGIISLDEQIAESRRYWQNIKLPDENVVFAGKHWEVVNRVLPSYNRFVQLGSNVNRKLKQDFDKWLEKRTPEECQKQLSTWIQTEVVPIYTLTSITYLKSLPGFTSFHADDQGILIRLGQSQSRILVAALHWYDSDERNFRNFMSWREIKFGSMDPYKQKLIDYAEKINQLELDSVESALLNVLIILATDYPGLKRPDIIEESQKQILGTFRAYTTAKFGAPNTRLENLFRYMPEIRRLGLIHYKMTLTPTLGVTTERSQHQSKCASSSHAHNSPSTSGSMF